MKQLRVAAIVGAVVVAVALSGVAYLSGGSADGEQIEFTVPDGMGANALAELLAEEQIVRSAIMFRARARFDNRANMIQAGTYVLRRGMGVSAALAALAQGPAAPDSFRVLIREGLTVAQTLQAIADADGSPFTVEQLRAALNNVALPQWVPAAQLPNNAEAFEGLLFPDTYDFRLDIDAVALLTRLVQQTQAVMDRIVAPEGFNTYQVLVTASLIEREARQRDEQARISSVIHNRLQRGMLLQIDASVLYALGEHKTRVLYRDLEIDSPWNTYRYAGLPPTPISGAGRAAIEAAANPADEDFLYYVVVDPETGRHGFSRTLEEHNRMRQQGQR